MWNKLFTRRNWTVVAILAVALGVLAGAVSDTPEEQVPHQLPTIDPKERLSVEETLGAVFDPGVGPGVRRFYARANPRARDAIYMVLDNKKLEAFHDNAWQVLGYIAGSDHVSQIERAVGRIKQTQGTLAWEERETLHILFSSLGVMCGRDVDGACSLAAEMMEPKYWQDGSFRLASNEDPTQLSSVNETIMWLMLGYSLSLDPSIEKHSRSILAKIDDPDQRKSLKGAFKRKLLLGHGRNTRAIEWEEVTAEERRELASCFNGDLENPGPAIPPRHIDADPQGRTNEERRDTSTPKVTSANRDLDQLLNLAYEVTIDGDGVVKLDLRGKEITDETIKLLREAPRLRLLHLKGVAVTDEGLKTLSDYAPHVIELELHDTAVTDDGLQHLSKFDQLHSLTIADSIKIGNRGLEHLWQLNDLRELYLIELWGVNDDAFTEIGSLENLKSLRIERLPVTDAMLERLGTLESLTSLDLLGCPVYGGGLKHLPKGLTRLALHGTPLTDTGLMQLHDMDQLQQIRFGEWPSFEGYRVRVTDEGVKAFEEALPGVNIVR